MFIELRYTFKLFITMFTAVGMELGVLQISFIAFVFNLALNNNDNSLSKLVKKK